MSSTVQHSSVSAELTSALLAAAEGSARELGLKISVTVVDGSGVLKGYLRMDGAPLMAEGASRKKALTAVGFGLSTGDEWHQFIKDDPILWCGAQQLDGFILLGGGVPLRIGGELVGAIGVSGGHYRHDEACARAALAAVGLEGGG